MRLNNRIAATAFRAVANVFGERVKIIPMQNDQHLGAVHDAMRTPVTTRAVVALSPSVDEFDGTRQGGAIQTGTRLAGREASIWLTPRAYAGIGYAVRPGDRVIFPERPEEPAYEVSRAPVKSDRGDVHIVIVQEGDR